MDKHKHYTVKLKQWMQKLKCSLREACFEKKMHTMQKRMNWEEPAYCHPQKPQATGRVTSSYSSSSWLLLKIGKGIPKSRKEAPHISSTALSSIAYWHGGNWIFPLSPRATNWNCPANLCPHEWLSQQRSKDLKPTEKSASASDPKTPGFTWKGEQGLPAAPETLPAKPTAWTGKVLLAFPTLLLCSSIPLQEANSSWNSRQGMWG